VNNLFVKRYRLFVIVGIIIILFVVLIVRLGEVQLEDKNKYSDSIDTQSIRIVRNPGIRGKIISSDDVILAENIPSYNIVFHPSEMRASGKQSKTVANIYEKAELAARLTDRHLSLTKQDIIKHMNLRPAIPITVLTGLTQEEMAKIAEYSPSIQGLEIISLPLRYYPYGEIGCHILGYVGKDDPNKAADKSDYQYYIPDVVGRSSIEKLYDQEINMGAGYAGLRGQAGSSLLRVNVRGFVHDDLGVSIPAKNGNDLKLTIDWRAEKAAYSTLDGKVGAIVVLNAENGAVVALASTPGFNPNEFTNGISYKSWDKLINAPDKPLLDRALLGTSMPGSIVKPLVALAALEDGLDPNEEIFSGRGVKIGNAEIKSWAYSQGGLGNENLYEALRDSDNVYFVTQGLRLGLDKLYEMYKHAGIGRKTGIGLPESAGLIPSRELKKKSDGNLWTAFDTGLISIGQGLISITPLQAAVYTAAIANGGTVYRPYLLDEIYSSSGLLLYKNSSIVMDKLPVSQKSILEVQHGMWDVVNDPEGGGRRAKNEFVTLYGKTGTAQVGVGEKKRLNTWFIGFWEKDGVTYSMSIFVQSGKAGGMTNAPMAKEFIEKWFGEE